MDSEPLPQPNMAVITNVVAQLVGKLTKLMNILAIAEGAALANLLQALTV